MTKNNKSTLISQLHLYSVNVCMMHVMRSHDSTKSMWWHRNQAATTTTKNQFPCHPLLTSCRKIENVRKRINQYKWIEWVTLYYIHRNYFRYACHFLSRVALHTNPVNHSTCRCVRTIWLTTSLRICFSPLFKRGFFSSKG